MKMDNEKIAAALEGLAEWYRTAPEWAPKICLEISAWHINRSQLADLIDTLPDSWMDKPDPDVSFLKLNKKFNGVTVTFELFRNNVCEKVQVGTRMKPAVYVESYHAPEKEEPVYEYRCPEIQ